MTTEVDETRSGDRARGHFNLKWSILSRSDLASQMDAFTSVDNLILHLDFINNSYKNTLTSSDRGLYERLAISIDLEMIEN